MVISGSAKPKLVALEQLSTNQWAMSRFTLESTKRQKKTLLLLVLKGHTLSTLKQGGRYERENWEQALFVLLQKMVQLLL